MKSLITCALIVVALPAQAAERRCGWVHNPTPGNWWLIDRQGSWTISTQGGREPNGVENLPEFGKGTWVMTNGNYGHGCGCMTVDTSLNPKRITRIYSSTVRPLRACRADKALPKP